jgi:hypothetical protein
MAGSASRTTTEASLSGAVVSPVTPVSAAESAPSARGRANLSLLGGFRLEVGGEIALLQPGGSGLWRCVLCTARSAVSGLPAFFGRMPGSSMDACGPPCGAFAHRGWCIQPGNGWCSRTR